MLIVVNHIYMKKYFAFFFRAQYHSIYLVSGRLLKLTYGVVDLIHRGDWIPRDTNQVLMLSTSINIKIIYIISTIIN